MEGRLKMTNEEQRYYVDPTTGACTLISVLAIKEKRKKLLYESDWTDTLSAKTRLGDDLYDSWQAYRQALRDIPTQPGYPDDVIWPTKP
jgi:hypothetical protein